MKRIATIAMALAGVTLLGATPSFAREAPWCVKGSLGRSEINICHFWTIEQCLQERQFWGNATCTQNPYYYWDARAHKWRKPQ
ncbi:MAG TPA: DUF3551 domain-containing protein [Xanthobacteraceae bacterium]|nr:DUF3551 domain-containing protein [Xanthobacteraceae bacterium]